MNYVPRAIPVALLIALVSGPATHAEPAARRYPTNDLSHSERVSEVRNHDAAFALLIETFQQLQTSRIEADYQNHLFAADQLADIESRARALERARQARALRLAKLSVKLEQLETSYAHARQGDERELGVGVVHQPDREAAATRLKEMAVFVPHSPAHRLSPGGAAVR